MTNIPKSHPRYESLIMREKIAEAMNKGLVHTTGLIAHGRGEAFDYLFEEKTQYFAKDAEKIAAAYLILAKSPVISVNGNVVALSAEQCISLAKKIPATLEVNLFHRTDKRINLLIDELKKQGADKVLGKSANKRIPGLNHDRGICEDKGIYSSDVILVPLEDGDRCKALVDMNKTVITIDLNPLSRTARTADVTIVDNVIRAIPNIEKWVDKLKNKDEKYLKNLIDSWDNEKNIKESLIFLSKRLNYKS